MYKLYTDKNENFIADVSVKNASLRNSIARLVVETSHVNLVFKGTIEEQKCTIPIKKLKGILDEHTTGKMYLEIIVEDVYFKPWESEFSVEEHTSMKVVVKEQEAEETKPILEVKVVEAPVIVESVVEAPKPVVESVKPPAPKPVKLSPAQEIALICERVSVTKKNFTKKNVVGVLREYFAANPELEGNKTKIIREFYNILKAPSNKK